MIAEQTFNDFLKGVISLNELHIQLAHESYFGDSLGVYTVSKFKGEYRLFRDNLMLISGIRETDREYKQ